MLSKDLEQSLNDAFREARDKRHEFMTVEHLLLALLDNPTVIELFDSCTVDRERLRLQDEKTSRDEMAQLFTELALRLNREFQLPQP